jgi:protease FtsH subunit HflK
MAWNEPGGNNRDPWSGGGGGGRGNQGPPDLDEVIRKVKSRLEGLFGGGGGRRSGGGQGGGEGKSPKAPGAKGIGIIVGVVFAGWVLSGIYIVDEGTRGLSPALVSINRPPCPVRIGISRIQWMPCRRSMSPLGGA